ncbi:hypothetical protein [Micromonospora sp. DH14]|uniref:hypothetical protein n=1 Tax=Micromonospora sp. DH14 TaxID=3040120 RepID=UPI0024425234|nr:hypothetical protein [Micromonospora sp. DH14]MDG9677712.1 hypothetical protein [Micromonospora sp. DH14]
MRGPLWRGWLWSPRIWWSRVTRRATSWYQGRQQPERRARAARPAAPARWWHPPWWWLALVLGAGVITAVWTLTQFALPLFNVAYGRLHGGGEPLSIFFLTSDWWCGRADSGQCAKLGGFLYKIVALSLVFIGFFLVMRYHVYRWYRRMARKSPEELVSTSNDALAEIVGRDELCEVLIERIRRREVRCPMVLVGGVGAGKSAVLVKLTHLLAARQVVPIPLRLRDVPDPSQVDFEALAKKRFEDIIDARLYSGGQADRLWRQLRWSNQIAVLADGLDELGGGGQQRQHDSVLREAFTKAAQNRLPLIVATRPYDPLRGMPAVVVGLEPLSEGTALEYGLTGEDRLARASWAVVANLLHAADVTESPIYLKVIRDLNRCGRLPQELNAHDEPGGASRPADRSTVRWALLSAWRRALEEGYIREDFARGLDDRRDALAVVSAFACAGFWHNSLEVTYDDLTDNGRWIEPDHDLNGVRQALGRRLNGRLDITSPDDLAVALTEAGELSVVDLQADGLRFQHGVIQAYLGVDLLAEEDVGRPLITTLLQHQPSRELLIALTLLSRRGAAAAQAQPTPPGGAGSVATPIALPQLVTMLRDQARAPGNRCWRLEMYATAVEIDTSAPVPDHDRLVADIAQRWSEFQENEAPDRPLDEAKLTLIRRWGDAARLVGDQRRRGGPAIRPDELSSYLTLFGLALREGSYRVRLAAVREIGLGGRDAAAALRKIGGPVPRIPHEGDTHAGSDRELQLRGWLVPLLYLSTVRDTEGPTAAADETAAHLAAWLRELAAYDATGQRRLGIASEIALAQGFRFAANIRHLPVGRRDADRSFLVEKAEFALRHSRYWYSQLALIQALTLLALPMDPGEPLPSHGHGASPFGLVQHWLRIAGSEVPGRGQCTAHPFLLETGRLCTTALATRQPERYCWVDEGETASRVGSCSPSVDVRRIQSLWIPDSMGWSVLVPRAERLLADVMLMSNLADRGSTQAEREERLHRADRCEVPPCLTTDRSAMEPERTVHATEGRTPGASCLDDCEFRLCPLPAKGEPLPHKMDQNFCARQADLATFRFALKARAPWQSVPRPGMRRFWRAMSRRDLPKWRRW